MTRLKGFSVEMKNKNNPVFSENESFYILSLRDWNVLISEL